MELPTIAPSEFTTTSRLIHQGPCIVKSLHVGSDASENDGHAQIYDGYNAKGKQKAQIAVKAGTSYTWRPGDGTDFDQGIYVALSAVEVTVTFIPESRKAFI